MNNNDMKQQCVANSQEKRHEWVGLTEEDKEAIYEEYISSPKSFIEITEAKLKEKNT
jgi:hypothetical protein